MFQYYYKNAYSFIISSIWTSLHVFYAIFLNLIYIAKIEGKFVCHQ